MAAGESFLDFDEAVAVGLAVAALEGVKVKFLSADNEADVTLIVGLAVIFDICATEISPCHWSGIGDTARPGRVGYTYLGTRRRRRGGRGIEYGKRDGIRRLLRRVYELEHVAVRRRQRRRRPEKRFPR